MVDHRCTAECANMRSYGVRIRRARDRLMRRVRGRKDIWSGMGRGNRTGNSTDRRYDDFCSRAALFRPRFGLRSCVYVRPANQSIHQLTGWQVHSATVITASPSSCDRSSGKPERCTEMKDNLGVTDKRSVLSQELKICSKKTGSRKSRVDQIVIE